MTSQEVNLRIELERLRIERKRLEIELQRERNRNGLAYQAKLLADLAYVGARIGLPEEETKPESVKEEPACLRSTIGRKRSGLEWIAEIDRMLEVVPDERIDRELFEEGPMSVADVANYIDKSEPKVRKLLKDRQLYQIPKTSPAKICPRSVVLFLVGLPDPRLES